MKRIIGKLKIKHLSILLIPLAIFVFSNVGASRNVIVTNKEELQRVVNNAYLKEKQNFQIEFTIESEDQFSNQTFETYCEYALEGIREMGAFYAAGVSCYGSGESLGRRLYVTLEMLSLPVNVKYFDKIMDFVETEGDKMYAQTKDKEQLIRKVYDKINEMYTNKHDFFYNEGSPLFYVKREGETFLASLFYDYFNIENHIIEGRGFATEFFWNLVNLGGNWYHISNYSRLNIYLASDTLLSKTYTWDYSAYPKAPKDYVTSTVKENTTIKPLITIEDIGTIDDLTTPVEEYDLSEGASSWAKEGVKEAINSGIVPSKIKDRYQASITRQEFCELVVMIYDTIKGTYVPTVKTPFTDTDDIAVAAAYELKIVNGVGGGKFAPSNLVTREQIAVMFNNLITALGIDPDLNSNYILFADDAQISGWAKDAVQVLVKLEIMNGVGDNRLNPKGNATREQAILLANKLYNLYK